MSHLDEEQLSLQAAGRLDAATAAAAQAHLHSCGDCRDRLEQVSAFVLSKTVAAPDSGRADSTPLTPTTHPDRPSARDQAQLTPPPSLGQPLGRYVLLEQLGSGGMGDVFAAYDPQLDRKVALKLLRRGTLSATEGRARLLREAQAMARLQHPNVVTVHDVGTLNDRVFIAMEFIEGETLSQWMRQPRTWQQTLRVFLMAGSGLSAAHRAGIVHRDFKPDNILIGVDDRPRVLDFGLARQASSNEAPKVTPSASNDESVQSPLGTVLTRDGAVMGTPGYMAPEQLGGLPTDARSDQFSFCVAMYEALYGFRPFGGATLKAHAAEIELNRLPAPPLGYDGPQYLWEALKRGLKANPAARWPDMDALLAALHPTQKVVRRGRTAAAVVALGLVAATALGFSVWSSQRLRVCGGAEGQLTGVWDAASKSQLKQSFAATHAPYANDAFRGVESALDAYAQAWVWAQKDSCEAVRIRKTDSEDLYEKKSLCLGMRLRQLKATVALLENADREVVSHAVAAARGLDRIDDCRDAVALASHPVATDLATKLREETLHGQLSEAKALLDSGKYALGAEVARAAIAGGGTPLDLAQAQLLLGRLTTRAGDSKAAEESFFAAATQAEQAGDAALTAKAFSRLYAVVGGIEERFEAAHLWERLARAAAARLTNDPDVEAELASNSGDVALSEGRPLDAKKEFERALRIRESTLPEGHPDLAMTLNNLGTAQAQLKQFDEAARSYERSLELHLQYEGREHPNTASSMNNLAVVYRKQGRFSEALTLLDGALEIRLKTLGPDHPDVASSHLSLAHLLERMERSDQAVEHLRIALDIRQRAFGAEHPQVATIHADIADLYVEQHAYAEALVEAQRALVIDEKTLGAQHLTTSAARERVGLIDVALGQWEKASGQLTAALEARRTTAGEPSVEVARSYNALGVFQLAEGRPDRALGLFQRALATREKAQGSTASGRADDLVGIGRCHSALKSPQHAVDAFSQAVALRDKGDDATELASARFELAKSLWELSPSNHEKALAMAEEARKDSHGLAQVEVEKWLTLRQAEKN